MMPGWIYSAPAIGWALALFGLVRLSAAKVRRLVSPWSAVGACAAAGWASLKRWARAVTDRRLYTFVRPSPPGWTPQQVAGRVGESLAALSLEPFPACRFPITPGMAPRTLGGPSPSERHPTQSPPSRIHSRFPVPGAQLVHHRQRSKPWTHLPPRTTPRRWRCFAARSSVHLTRCELDHGQLRAELWRLSKQRCRPLGGKVTRRYAVTTLERWYYAYGKGGLSALRPKRRSDRGRA